MAHYQLYSRAGTASMVVEAALRLTGAGFQNHDVPDRNSQKQSAFLAINPAGKIPVLITPQGQTIFESTAILLVLDERHPEAKLLPPFGTNERAIAVQWLAFMATSTYSAALRYYYPEAFTTDNSDVAITAVKAAGASGMDRDFEILAAALKNPYLLGETMTIADVYLAMLADWHEPAMEIAEMQRLKAEVLKSSAVRAAWGSHEFTA